MPPVGTSSTVEHWIIRRLKVRLLKPRMTCLVISDFKIHTANQISGDEGSIPSYCIEKSVQLSTKRCRMYLAFIFKTHTAIQFIKQLSRKQYTLNERVLCFNLSERICNSTAECQPSKLVTRVRFPSDAPSFQRLLQQPSSNWLLINRRWKRSLVHFKDACSNSTCGL